MQTVAGLIALFWFGCFLWSIPGEIRHWREKRKLNRLVAALDEWGYRAGRMGFPPDFYKSERIADKFDFADEMIVLCAWQTGFDEYLAAHRTAQPQ